MKQRPNLVLQSIRRKWSWVAISLILAIAAWFRLWQLSNLPPGLHYEESKVAVRALHLFSNPSAGTFAPGLPFVALQATMIKLIGNTLFATRLIPALLGLVGVGVTYLWAKTWFGNRVATTAAFLLAITPWSVTFARNATAASFVLMITPLVLWTATKAYQTRNYLWFLATVLITALGFYTYPQLIVLPIAIALTAGYVLFSRPAERRELATKTGISVAVLSVLTTAITLISVRWGGYQLVIPKLNLTGALVGLLDRLIKTSLMFNFYGDSNYFHNLAGQPMLNVFVGVMFILGLLIALSHLKQVRLAALIVILITVSGVAMTKDAPNAAAMLPALPAVVVLSALGINYMLDRWYKTFPLNPAARTLGLAAILLLLALSAYHGYQQYFVAWAKSDEVADAYQRSATEMSTFLNGSRFSGQHYVLANSTSLEAIEYLTEGHTRYQVLKPSTIPPDSLVSQLFLIAPEYRVEAVQALRQKLPKGRLSPHYFASGNESFNVYEVSK